MERAPGAEPKPHHSRAKTPAMLDRQRGPATAGVLARDTWHYSCGFGPAVGEAHTLGSCSRADCREGRSRIIQHSVIRQPHNAIAAGTEDCLLLLIRRPLPVMD